MRIIATAALAAVLFSAHAKAQPLCCPVSDPNCTYGVHRGTQYCPAPIQVQTVRARLVALAPKPPANGNKPRPCS